MIQPSSASIAQRAQRLYEFRLRKRLERDHTDKFVAIEPDSEDYFIGETMSDALAAARHAHRDRLPLVLRIGHKATVHVGGVVA